MQQEMQYRPSGAVDTRSPPATQHRLQNKEWPQGGPNMVEGVWKKQFRPKSFYQKLFDQKICLTKKFW